MTPRGALVVVGVDASASSRGAFNWVVAASPLLVHELRLVHAWSAGADPAEDAVQRDPRMARRRAVALVDAFEAMVPAGFATVRASAIEGWPGQVLVDQATDADLLVVGRRGRGAIRRIVARSVSTYVVGHAPCPVVVVREGRDDPRSPALLQSHSLRSPASNRRTNPLIIR